MLLFDISYFEFDEIKIVPIKHLCIEWWSNFDMCQELIHKFY